MAVAAVTVVLVVGLCWLALAGQALIVVLLGLGVLLATGWRPADWIPPRSGHGERPPSS